MLGASIVQTFLSVLRSQMSTWPARFPNPAMQSKRPCGLYARKLRGCVPKSCTRFTRLSKMTVFAGITVNRGGVREGWSGMAGRERTAVGDDELVVVRGPDKVVHATLLVCSGTRVSFGVLSAAAGRVDSPRVTRQSKLPAALIMYRFVSP